MYKDIVHKFTLLRDQVNLLTLHIKRSDTYYQKDIIAFHEEAKCLDSEIDKLREELLDINRKFLEYMYENEGSSLTENL